MRSAAVAKYVLIAIFFGSKLLAATEENDIIDPSGLVARLEGGNCILLDVRPEIVYKRGHIPAAVNLPLGEARIFEDFVAQIGKTGRPIIIYCTSLYCKDSETMRKMLSERAIDNIIIFKGGYAAWFKGGLPIER